MYLINEEIVELLHYLASLKIKHCDGRPSQLFYRNESHQNRNSIEQTYIEIDKYVMTFTICIPQTRGKIMNVSHEQINVLKKIRNIVFLQ